MKLAAFDVNTETSANVAALEAEKMGISRSLLKAATVNARQLGVYLRLVRQNLVSLESDHLEDKAKVVGIIGEILQGLRGGQDPCDPALQVSVVLILFIMNEIVSNWNYLTRFKLRCSFYFNDLH